MTCPTLPDGTGFVSGMLRFVDCEVQTLGASGYQALSAPGSSFSLILTGLLTLFVAVFGYRLLLGSTLTVRDGVLAMVKIGVVLVLATSWPAYRTLVYDVALRGPAELAADIGAPAELPGTGGGMVARLDFADRALAALAVAGTGPVVTPQPGDAADDRIVPPPFAGFDAFAFGGSRILFLTAVIGAFAAVRIVAGLLLALAPLFFAFLLFDATRGLFEGWLRVLAGAALAAAGIAIMLGIELALIEPWLIWLLNERAAGVAIPSAPVELLVVTLVFCLALLAMLYATARVTMGFRLAPLWRMLPAAMAPVSRSELPQAQGAAERGAAPNEARSRAAAIADAVATSQRREAAGAVRTFGGQSVAGAPSRGVPPNNLRDVGMAVATPLGQSFRRTTTRASASAARRDRT